MRNKHCTPSGWRCSKIQIGWRPSTVATHKDIPMVTFMSPVIWILGECRTLVVCLPWRKSTRLTQQSHALDNATALAIVTTWPPSRVDETRDEFSHDFEAATRRIGSNTTQVLQEDSQRQGCERQVIMSRVAICRNPHAFPSPP